MIQQTRRYGYIKTMTWQDLINPVNLTPGVSSATAYDIDLRGLVYKGFFILGAMYFPYIIDMVGPPPGPNKYFNHRDPLIWTFMKISKLGTPVILGDDIQHLISGADWSRGNINIEPFRHYDFYNSPISVSGSSLRIGMETCIDPTVVAAGTIQIYMGFMLTFGTDMPLKMASGQVIPPPLPDNYLDQTNHPCP